VSPAVQVLAPTALRKVEDLLLEARASRGTTDDDPSISSVGTFVPEQNPGMTATFKHFNSHSMRAATKVLNALPIAPAVQTVVVDSVSTVDPQL
jgi:hypothetical protein